MLKAKVPVVSVCAVRTGAGKSQTTRRVASILRAKGRRVVAIRHPMPYGDLVKQKVQRFAAIEDLDRHQCTIEEREEYEPHIVAGGIIYAGVDYGAILRAGARRRPTSSSGTAATTTCRSTARTSRSWWPTRTGRATRRPTTRARRTCAWPTWS